MTRLDTAVVMAAAFMGFAVLYAPQPILPVLAAHFGTTVPHAATLITWSLIPMSVGPVFVGVLMQTVAPRRLLALSALGLGLSEIVFYQVDAFAALQAVRFVQGVLVAVLVPATMTYIALTAERMRELMAGFVAASVLGGLIGRITAGYVADLFDWRLSFLGLGVVLVVMAVPAFWLSPERVPSHLKIRLERLVRLLRDAFYVRAYAIVFAGFFAYMALLNFIPFRLGEANRMGSGDIALSYSGFLLAVGVSLLSPWITRRVGGELRTVLLGLGLTALAVGLAWSGSVAGIIAAVAAASCGFFLLHSVLAGYVNARAGAESATANGLYVGIYYLGGVIGSYAPGLVYVYLGWPAFVAVLGAMIGVAVALTGVGLRVGDRG